MLWSSTPQGVGLLASIAAYLLPSALRDTVGPLKMHDFGAQYKACMYPCPTLPVRPHDRPRMARGQDGSLFLSCTTLSFAASCRFIPALSTHECVGHVLRGSIRLMV